MRPCYCDICGKLLVEYPIKAFDTWTGKEYVSGYCVRCPEYTTARKVGDPVHIREFHGPKLKDCVSRLGLFSGIRRWLTRD